MISFSDEQIKLLRQICQNLEQKSEFASRLDLDIDTVGGGVKFGEILDGDGKPSGLSIKGIYKTEDSQANLFLSLDRRGEGKLYDMRDLRFDIGSILGMLKKFGIEKTRIVLNFKEIQLGRNDGPKYLRNDFTFSELKDAERVASDYNSSIYYSEYLDSKVFRFTKANIFDQLLEEGILWNLDQVKRANLVVDKLIDVIKKEKLSPLQTVAFISAFAFKNFSYSHFEPPVDPNYIKLKGEIHNNIVAAVNCKEIQCVGYDQFFNAIARDLFYHFMNNGDHLISESIGIQNPRENHGGHAVSVVDLKDEKYGVGDRFLVDINLNSLNILKRPRSDFNLQRFPNTKDVDNNLFDRNGNQIDSKDFLERICMCPLCTDFDGYRYVPPKLYGKYFAQDRHEQSDKKFFGPKYKSFKVLHLSKMSNKDCVKLMSKVYDDIKDVKIPSIEDLFRQPVDKEPNL